MQLYAQLTQSPILIPRNRPWLKKKRFFFAMKYRFIDSTTLLVQLSISMYDYDCWILLVEVVIVDHKFLRYRNKLKTRLIQRTAWRYPPDIHNGFK